MDVNFTEKLIQEVRNRPIIYLVSHPDYKNNTKKLQAWREVQRELNVEVKILKSKWKNLKDTYNKYKQSRQITSSQAAKKLSNWAWADHMSFMDPSFSPNDTQISIELSSANVEHDTSSTSGQSREVKQEIEFSAVEETHNEQEIYPMVQYLHNRRRSRTRDDKVEVKCDGVDLLFLGYADTFKKLSKRKQVSVKFDIAKVLMEAELSDLQDTTANPESYSAASGSYSMARKSRYDQ
ncbi:transcription factor Adf-1-like [Maniola jurtina]|uniref:transcription factor Adf-1-like n=1 Tax=Maniola jurtina TaxID=191418 RepID=UPI001E686EFA|nr:transcription factor Adf-1-like [Maniola jurtina]